MLEAVCDGVSEGGGEPRIVRVRRVADVAFIAHDGARLSGSRVAIGLQSKGTAVIHRADLQPLDNLELFGMSPLYTLESYRAMGRNAAGYALGRRVGPVPTQLDNFARAKLIVRTTLLHARETQAIVPGAAAVELELARARRFRRMKVEFLFWEGCPSYPEARELLESLLVEHGLEQPIDVVEVVTQEDAVRLAFPGSPTIRIDGRDVDEAGAQAPSSLTCRVYRLPDGRPSPVPGREQIEEALS